MIKAVFIDIDDTLLDFNLNARNAIKKTFEDNGIEYTDAVYPIFKRINLKLWHDVEDGIIDKSSVYNLRWAGIFEECGINYRNDAFEENFYNNFAEFAEKIDGAEDILAYLSSKYTVYGASNAPQNQQNIRLKKAGLDGYIKDVFTSELVGYSKPLRGFFDECLKRTGLTAQEVVLIGDSLTADISGGLDYGIETIWLYNTDTRGIGKITPDHTVYSLAQIKDIL